MLRQFLTVLALISGFAALAEPVQAARIASDIAASSEAEQGQPCASAHSGLVAAGLRSDVQRAEAKKYGPCLQASVFVPTIQLKADRARE